MTSGGPWGWPCCCLRRQSTDEEGNYRPANSTTSTDLYRGYELLALRLCSEVKHQLKKGTGAESNWRGQYLFIVVIFCIFHRVVSPSLTSPPLANKCVFCLWNISSNIFDFCHTQALSHPNPPAHFHAPGWVRVFVWNINRPLAPLRLCSRTRCWPCVSGSSLRPSVGDRHQGGFQEGALSHMQASPESSIALGTDALDLLGDRALKLAKLPNHCSRCYKGYCYVNAASTYQAQEEPQSLCHFWGYDFSAVFVLFM